MMRTSLLDNAQILGSEITAGYSMQEDVYLNEYSTILTNAATAVHIRLEQQDDISVIRQWLSDYQDYIEETTDIKGIEIYAAVYGKIAGATYWEVDEVIDPTQTNWYQMAIEANRKNI